MVMFNYLKLSLCLIENTKLKLLTMNLINQIVQKLQIIYNMYLFKFLFSIKRFYSYHP